MKQLKIVLIIVFSLQISTWAQETDAVSIPDKPPVTLDFPVLEMPFNQSRYFPDYFSMRQSLAFSMDFYQSVHWMLAGPPENHREWKSIFLVAAFDVFSGAVPLGNSWLHEEWHRSVMTNRKVGSFNDVNTFPFGKNLIAVSHVDDQDLIRLKRDHPADQVRLSSAGMESQVQQNLLLEKNLFFYGSKSQDKILIWLNAINVSSYLAGCSSGYADESTDDQNEEDGADISKRDFTGLDCTAWVYDLFRPDEPYTSRGIHPSGIGIDRYIRYSDLNQKEKDFLHRQMMYSFLNFADPFMFRRNEFRSRIGDRDVRWNFKLAHYLTSFGGTIDAILFLEAEAQKFLLTWHHGMTDTRYFPGVSAEWIDVPLPWNSFYLTTGLTLWQQPQQQRVEESSGETLVSASAQVSFRHNRQLASYAGLEGKTPGWQAGNVYLDKNVSVWTGFKWGAF